jgi:hypothetical protein
MLPPNPAWTLNQISLIWESRFHQNAACSCDRRFPVEALAADVEIRFVDLPTIEGATGRFLLQQMASVAELDAGMRRAWSGSARASANQ